MRSSKTEKQKHSGLKDYKKIIKIVVVVVVVELGLSRRRRDDDVS